MPKARKVIVMPQVDPLTGLARLLTLKQVAHYYGTSTRTVRRYVQARKLTAIRFDGDLRFRFEDVERFLDKRTLRAA